MITIQTSANSENNLMHTNVRAKKGMTDKRAARTFHKARWYQLLYRNFENVSRFHTPMIKNKQRIIVKMSLKSLLPATDNIIF